ncbi:MAG: helix-turn-helix transcriptional regulator [Synechococcaceae cyanobacterium]|nr:helix-turn-helix transcriptional regulator [Synechococcaceae cyanobacterium]
MSPPIKNLPHQLLRDPDAAAEAIGRAAPVQEFRLLTPRSQFFLSIAHQPIGTVLLSSFASSDLTFLTEHVDGLHLVACANGGRRVVTPVGAVECRAGGALLLPPGQRRAFGSHSAAIFTLPSAAIRAAAGAMVGGSASESLLSFAPHAIQPGPIAAVLHQLLPWIDQCLACDLALPERLGADDVVLRQVAALLDPTLLDERPGDDTRLRERQGSSAFDDLIDHIRANLDQPLRLSDLEARSNYSRRSLQYAFQQKLGTTPMAWIRAQRLERAMERLREGGPEVTVKAVALSCGYRCASQFSADFQRRFGMSPSAVLRQPL